MTSQEQHAIATLREAIRAAHKLGIRLAGMDGELLYATSSAFKKGKKAQEIAEAKANGVSGCYSVVAHAVQECNGGEDAGTLDSKCYEDSGGW